MSFVSLARSFYWRWRRLVINSVCALCGHSEDAAVPDMTKRLLVLAPEGMVGDFVLMSPFLRALRKRLPGAFICLAVPGGVRALAEHCPCVDEVLRLPKRSVRALVSKIMGNIFWARRILRPKNFDAAILATDNVDYYLGTLMIYFAGIPVRVGFSNENSALLHPRKGGLALENLLNVRVPFMDGVLHQSLVFLRLLEPFGGVAGDEGAPEVWEAEDDAQKASEFFMTLDSANIERRPYFALGVSAGAAKRDWGLANYKNFVAMADAKFKPFWIFVGPESDRWKHDIVFEGAGVSHNAAGQFSLTRLHAALRGCAVYVGPDSGPAHVAAAAGCRVLEVSCHPEGGSPCSINSPERFGPLTNKIRIVRPQKASEECSEECKSHAAHCVLNTTPSDLLRALEEIVRDFPLPDEVSRSSEHDLAK